LKVAVLRGALPEAGGFAWLIVADRGAPSAFHDLHAEQLIESG